MKYNAHLFIALASVFSVSCFAQRNDRSIANAKMENMQILSDMMSNNDLAVVSYHVEERINMNFGSNITTYDVPSLNMVSTNDLGPNNSRIVTPKYAKIKAVVIEMPIEKPKVILATITTDIKPIKINSVPLAVKKNYVTIDVVSTYERVLDNGFKSPEMIKKVADRHFFDDDLTVAARWYSELFSTTTDLDAVYYYRYALSLKAINELEKADEMMKIFESKSL